MGELADRLAALVIEATSPDGQISARVSGRGEQIRVRFRPGVYRHYTEDRLGAQIAHLATTTWVSYKRGTDEIIRRHCRDALDPDDDGADFGPERKQNRLRLEGLVAAASSPDGRIKIASRALVRWKVVIASGTLGRMSETEFCAALHTAVHSLIADYAGKMQDLKREITAATSA